MARKKLTYEEAAAELKRINDALAKGDTSLDETVRLYEKGMELSKLCTGLLDEYDGRIKKVSAKLEKESAAEADEDEPEQQD